MAVMNQQALHLQNLTLQNLMPLPMTLILMTHSMKKDHKEDDSKTCEHYTWSQTCPCTPPIILPF